MSEIKIVTRKLGWIKDPTEILKLVQGHLHIECTLRSSSKSSGMLCLEKKKKVKEPQ